MSKSRYTYLENGKDTGVLVNNQNLRTPEELASFERQMTALKLLELENDNTLTLAGDSFDLVHLCAIHRFIFEDVYPTSKHELEKISEEQTLTDRRYFVGKIREEDIFKGGFRFVPALYVQSELQVLFRRLKKEKFLKGVSLEEMPKKLAYYMSELNVLHPFREGNGRTIREFIRQLACFAGYQLDWSKVNAKKELLYASIRSVANTAPLEEVLKKTIS